MVILERDKGGHAIARVALDEKPQDWLVAAKEGLKFAGWLGRSLDTLNWCI
jgi:hypothetical protein